MLDACIAGQGSDFDDDYDGTEVSTVSDPSAGGSARGVADDLASCDMDRAMACDAAGRAEDLHCGAEIESSKGPGKQETCYPSAGPKCAASASQDEDVVCRVNLTNSSHGRKRHQSQTTAAGTSHEADDAPSRRARAM
jgi:hypothetical protein